ncbi:hypothetical protein D3C76_1416990 [compost metagenome]
MRQHRLHIELARQGAVQAVHQQRYAKPQQTGLGTVVDQREERQQGQDHAAGGYRMGAPGLGFADVHWGDGQVHGRFSSVRRQMRAGYINV